MPGNKDKHSIAFYSPVRGSGVTTVVTHLFRIAPEVIRGTTVLVDCDLEFPSASAYFDTELIGEEKVTVFLPSFERGHCNLCKACAKACVFGAISLYSNMAYIHFDPGHCRACGACLNTCRHGAIREQEREIAVWRSLEAGDRRIILEGELLAEDFFSVKALQAVKKYTYDEDLRLIDARGGLDYMSLEAMHDADLLVVVIDVCLFSPEPWRQILELLQERGKKMVAVVNRSTVLPESIRLLCHQLSIPVAGCVSFDSAIPRNALQGRLMGKDPGSGLFQNILHNLLSHTDIAATTTS